MAATFTTSNRLIKQGHGDNVETWGDVLNAQGIDQVDDALDGGEAIPIYGTITLSSAYGAQDQARMRILRFSGTGGIAIIPGVWKWYIIHNNSSSSVTIKTASGVGATIQMEQISFVYCDGVDCFGATYTGSSTFASKVTGPQSNTAGASFNAPPGTSPTSPIDGDIWITNTQGLQYSADGLRLRPGSELIFSGDAGNISLVDFSFPKDFRTYEIFLNHLTASDSTAHIGIRLSDNNGAYYYMYDPDYVFLQERIFSTAERVTNGGTFAYIPMAYGISPFYSAMSHITIDKPRASAGYKPIRSETTYLYQGNTSNIVNQVSVGSLRNQHPLTNIRIFMTSGVMYLDYAFYGRR